MKKIISFFLALSSIFLFSVQAQNTAVFGTGTSATSTGGSAGSPMSSGTLYSYTQNIYTAAELTAANVPAGSIIIGIAFSNGTATNTTMNNICTYMGHKSTTSFSSTTDWLPYNQLILVDSSNWSTTASGWIPITLQTPFVYNGVDNLLIGVTFGGASSSATNCGYYYTTESENRHIRRYLSYSNTGAEYAAVASYAGTATPSGTSFTQSVSSNRPNLQITYILSNCPSPTPQVANIGPYSAELNWINYNQSALSWDLKYGLANTFDTLSGGTSITGITDTFYSLTSLTPNTPYQVYLKSYCSTENGTWSVVKNFTSNITCPVPANVSVVSVTANDVTIDFQNVANTGTAWVIEYGPQGFTPGAGTIETVSSAPYTLSNLTDNTYYSFRLRADCTAGDTSNWTSLITFKTSCVPISSLPYTENFDSIETGVTIYPDCWYKLNTYSSDRPYVHSTHYEGTGSLYFYASSGTNNIAIMPPFESTISINTLMTTFMYYATSSSYYLIVGVMDNPIDASTFVPVDTIQYGTTSTWHEFEVAFNNYTGTGQYIAFMNIGNGAINASYIDNISVDLIPSCIKPIDVTVSSITETGATVTWTPRGTESSWEVVVVPYGEDMTLATPEVTSAYPYTLTGLSGDTRYQVYVRADCGAGDYSNWTPSVTFRTTCPTYLTLPYTEYFDSYGALSGASYYPQCWSRLTNSSTNYPYLSTSYHASGTNALYFYATTTYYSIAISPLIDTITNPINSLSVSFKLLKTSTTSTYGRCEIGVMTDPTDASTFTTIATVLPTDLSATYTWYEFDYQLTNYTGSGAQYIAFRAPNVGTNVVYLDDVTIYPTPTCLKPLSVQLSGLSSNSITVNWTPRNNETSWEIAVVPTGVDPSTVTPEYASSRPYTVLGLIENTTYDVYVRSDCGNGDMSTWSPVVTFTTLCLPTDIVPFTENFDNCSTGASAALPDCWLKYTNYTTAYPYPSSTYHSSGSNSIYFYSTSTNYSYLVSQALDLQQYAAGSLVLSCKTLKSSATYGRLNIGYMTDPSDMNTFVLLRALYPSDYAATLTWYDQYLVINETFTTPIYLAFVSPAGGTSYAYLDDVSLDYIPDCSDPTDLIISNVEATSAMVSWTASSFGATDYTVEYSETGLANWTTAGIVTGTQVLISGLLPTTTYDVRVSANCSSSISNYLTDSFTTTLLGIICSAEDTVSIGTGTNTAYYIPVNNYYNYTYSQQIFDASELNMTNGGILTGIAFDYYYSTSNTDKDEVVIYLAHTTQSTFTSSTSWIPISSAMQVYSGDLVCTQGWNYFEFDSPFAYNGTDNLVLIIDDNSGAYNGTAYTFNTHSASGKTIYYCSDSSNPDPANPPTASSSTYAYRNNVKFINCTSSTPITCVAPNAYISDVDDQSVTLTWAPGSSETSWELEYKLVTETTWTIEGPVTTSPYTISGLTADSDYQIRIRSNCSPDYSEWVTLSFSTECQAVVTLPLMENFDSAPGSGSGNFISCWKRGSNYTSSTYPSTINSQSVSSPYSLYFYGTSSYYSYAVTPRFDASIIMDSLQVAFQMRKSTASYFIEVGIMTDPNDMSTFIPVGTATPSAINIWELAEINTTAYNGTGHYVAFRIPQWITSYMYIDDISIQYIPNCLRIENLYASNILANQADILWTQGSDENVWEYLYGPSGTVDFENDIPNTATVSSAQITGLTANTLYDVYVRAMCQNGEYSAWTSYSFRTACDEISTLPYYEDFDTYGTGSSIYPTCWYKINTYSSDRPYINTTNYSSPGALYFYAGTSGTYNMAITPEFATTIPVNTLQVSFQYRTTYASDMLIIGVMSSPTDASTFVPVDTVTNTSTSTWYQKRVSLENYTGAGQYIAFKNSYTTTYGYGYLDDVEIDILPSCDDPFGFNVSALTGTTADLTWQDAATETSWQLLIVPQGATPDFNNAITVSVPPYQATGLTANTLYDAYLRTVCANGLGYSNWMNLTFMTISANPAQTPYCHAFDDGVENAEWALMNGTCTNKWFIGMPTGETDSILFISNDNGTTNGYNISSTAYVWAYRDIQFGTGAEFNLSIKWRANGESCCDYLRFYIGTPMAVTPGTSLVEPIGAEQLSGDLNMQSSWQEYSHVFDASYANSIKRLYIFWRNDGSIGTTPSGAIDTVQITVSDCGRPYNVTASNLTTTSADVTFTPAMATDAAWEYVVGIAGFNPDAATATPLTSTSFQITGLTAATNYSVYVRTACTSGGYSAWSDVSNFFTLCASISIPYTENFDAYGAGSSLYYPNCWSRITTYSSNYPYISSTNYSSPGSLYFYANTFDTYNLAVSPQIDVMTSPMNTLQVSFQYRPSNSTSRLIVGVMTDNTNASTFVPIDTVSGTASTWAEHTVMFNGYTGTGSFIAFKNEYTTTTGNGYMDNVFIELIPTCPRPADITVTGTTSSTVTLAWTTTGTETNWNIVYGASGFDPTTSGTTLPATTNPFTVTGLTSAVYDFYVQANCGAGDVSTWRGPASAAPGSINMSTTGTNTVTMCEGAIFDDGGATGNYSNSCSSTLIINPSTTGAMVQITGNYTLESCCDEIIIYDGSSTSGTSLFNSSQTSTGNINVTSTTGPLTIYFESDGSVSYSGFALTVACSGGTPSTCTTPTALAAVPSDVTANITWTAGGTETAWILEYKLASATTWTPVNVATTPAHTLTGLTVSTDYNVRVKAVCGATDESEYTATVNFTTLAEPCDVPTNVQVVPSSNGATVTWTSTESAWIVGYRLAGSANWTESPTLTTTTYQIVGLQQSTDYEVRVKSVCSPGESAFTANVAFTTTAGGTTTYTITASATGPGTITPSGVSSVQEGSNITFTITPNADCSASLLLVDDVETAVPADNQYTFTNVTANHTIAVTFTTGINEIVLDKAVTLYPNPASTMIELMVNNDLLIGREAVIYDVYGKQIAIIPIEGEKTQIDISNFASGVYVVRITADQGMVMKKFIKK